MTDRRWARLWKRFLVPIDWEALAIEQEAKRRRTRKGDKRPREDVERKMASQRRNARRRQREAAERALERQRAARQAKGRLGRGEARAAVLAACEAWTTRPEIRKATGMDYGTVKGAVHVLVQGGLLEQRAIAAPAVPRCIEPVARFELRATARGRAWLAWWRRSQEK